MEFAKTLALTYAAPTSSQLRRRIEADANGDVVALVLSQIEQHIGEIGPL